MIKVKIIDPQKPDQIQEVDLKPETMLNQECLIGRFINCDLVLDSLEVSRMHGKFSKKNGNYYFTDLGSRCGSQVNNINVKVNQDYPLQQGDKIQIGRFFLIIAHLGLEENIEENIPLVSEEDLTVIEVRKKIEKQTISDSDTQRKLVGKAASSLEEDLPIAIVDPSQLQRWIKGELTVRCIGVIDETHNVKTFRFVADPPVLFTYKPGQFITLDLEINGEEISRSYSISSAPSRPHTLEITVKRLPPPPNSEPEIPSGLVSNWLHENITVGSNIKINGPYGKFTCFTSRCQKLLLISAGSGITPMMSMSRCLLDIGFTGDLIFFHCAHSPRDIIFRQELEFMAAQYSNFHLAISTTYKEPGYSWLGLTGRLNASMLEVVAPDFRERSVYVCGPDGFMKNVSQILESFNFPMKNFYKESFGPQHKSKSATPKPKTTSSASETLGPPVAQSLKQIFRNLPTDTAAEYYQDEHIAAMKPIAAPTPILSKSTPSQTTVVFSKSSKEVVCDGEDSILVLARQEGIKIKSSCLTGVCGSCKQRKLQGDVMVEGEPEGLEESELQEGYILTCISYPVGRVVVDV
jgi:ferredoxin-NADP reductase/pSer/pThr/pTyr-binding forkhead associated (FHA) protein/ferredoxin